ncbi:hypothetical protein [Mycobacterium marseillense]|uniref:Uncharacterized protein n=1 Tax=Mycobacterium marseillense TaxID=701042 RepID=A0ABM7J791_9MYCO|nr:hypothetical protein [Mycobacterium marseillense]MCA2262738.1 hypothetical protein [Mycobacterium marseillense]MCV7403322.1 hypothetical protein [Mycobacterium marseillense]BBY09683.1 hypothetical protein MMARJ_04230 [Mycobacterium marseillense]
MSTEPGNASPPPPDPPNLSPGGKWGVAPSSRPQMTRAGDRFKYGLGPWWALAVLIVMVIVVVVVALA